MPERLYQVRAEPVTNLHGGEREIPKIDASSPGSPSEAVKEKAKLESWFQWFEDYPVRVFSAREFSAGIPTWAMGKEIQKWIR